VTAYFDASALTKLFLAEPGWDRARSLWESSEILATSWIALPEVRSALERAHREGRIGRRRLGRALAELHEAWSDLVAVLVDAALAGSAAALAGAHELRGQDAIHLASALRLADSELVLATWDRRLRQAALDEGVAVAPA
jgi:predicted nucleic acid-binding protein